MGPFREETVCIHVQMYMYMYICVHAWAIEHRAQARL
jgi:hypothetical protein